MEGWRTEEEPVVGLMTSDYDVRVAGLVCCCNSSCRSLSRLTTIVISVLPLKLEFKKLSQWNDRRAISVICVNCRCIRDSKTSPLESNVSMFLCFFSLLYYMRVYVYV